MGRYQPPAHRNAGNRGFRLGFAPAARYEAGGN